MLASAQFSRGEAVEGQCVNIHAAGAAVKQDLGHQDPDRGRVHEAVAGALEQTEGHRAADDAGSDDDDVSGLGNARRGLTRGAATARAAATRAPCERGS
jgi:hypothetical protein